MKIAFLVAALNDLEITAANFGNAYLNAPCQEIILKISGSKFGSNKGCAMIVVRALYVLNSSGVACRDMPAHNLHGIGYQPTQADSDVWINMITIPDGRGYYVITILIPIMTPPKYNTSSPDYYTSNNMHIKSGYNIYIYIYANKEVSSNL